MRVIGPDEANHRGELLKQIKLAGLQDAWIFDDAVDGSGKWNALRSSDLFILPTHSENFGIAVAEALGCGVPVITTHGAPWQVLEERECGWWVPVNAESLMGAMKDAMSRSSEELSAMGERGRKVAEERFSWDTISEDMLTSYSWLLRGGEKPRCVLTI
jgi:glycosyltransferase involved in cell wall biosynthesis